VRAWLELLELRVAMTLPRQVIPGRYLVITRRCAHGQFLMRPDDDTNNAFLYCLMEAAVKYGIDVILTCAMSNHHHTAIRDRYGRVSEFMQRFHAHFSKCQNALHGRWENHWSIAEPSIVELADREALIESLAYIATNPVKDHLVDQVHHWPGVNCLNALLSRTTLHATRPKHFFSDEGPMPETVDLALFVPDEFGDQEVLLSSVRQRCKQIEDQCAAERQQTGRGVLGRRRILRQSWRDFPTTTLPRREISPRVKTRNKWRRIEALQRNHEFVKAYRIARLAWLAGATVEFPFGTNWLRRFAGVPVAPRPSC
jgi:REP-associated tyrosine transposase